MSPTYFFLPFFFLLPTAIAKGCAGALVVDASSCCCWRIVFWFFTLSCGSATADEIEHADDERHHGERDQQTSEGQ